MTTIKKKFHANHTLNDAREMAKMRLLKKQSYFGRQAV